jgi:transposase-like protein
MPNQISDVRRRRRSHSSEFKAQVVAACRHPGISIAAVAMATRVLLAGQEAQAVELLGLLVPQPGHPS